MADKLFRTYYNEKTELSAALDAGKILVQSGADEPKKVDANLFASQLDLNSKENTSNKQNSLAVDGTGAKYPTVDAVNAANNIQNTELQLSQKFTSFGESSVNNFRSSMLDLGDEFFTSSAGYQIGKNKQLGLEPSLQMLPISGQAGKLRSIGSNRVNDFTVSRNSIATYIDEDGLIKTALANVPRFDYSEGLDPSLLLEPQQTQIYELTEVMSTQTKTVTAVSHTVGFYGTGTLTFTGAFTGSLVGTGINDRVELIFTPTAGSLVSTVSGSVTKSQLVTGNVLGSYIPNTTTGTVTRLADVVDGAGDVNTFNSEEGVLYAEIAALANNGTFRQISINNATNSNMIQIDYTTTNNQIRGIVVSGGVYVAILTFILSDITINSKVALKFSENDFSLWFNGVKVATDSSGVTPTNLSALFLSNGGGTNNFFGRCKDLRVYKTALTDAQLTELTTL
jgi:hypothetical protein